MGEADSASSQPVDLMSEKRMRQVHAMAARYLNQYISQNKKEINGTEFAILIEQLRVAKSQGFID